MSRVLDPVVIGQDEQSELHIQPVIQSGRRHIDIRMWRRGPGGFAPSRNAITLAELDLDALYEGVGELLQASNGGTQVARVVWDRDEGRRLRAETEPFGLRFMARLGFWQRVRDTWRPADDGLVVAAEHLQPLLRVLEGLRSRFLEAKEIDLTEAPLVLQPEQEQRWPTPGADWLTIDPDRVTFHPRGLRLTATIEEKDGRHMLRLSQWRRQESIWIPEDASVTLAIGDLDALLGRLRGGEPPSDPILRDGMPPIRTRIQAIASPPLLLVEEDIDEEFIPRLHVPVDQIPRFGRMLAQAGSMLIVHMSAAERDELLRSDGKDISPEIAEDALKRVEAEMEDAEEAGIEGEDADTDAGAALEVAAMPERRIEPLGEIRLGHLDVSLQGFLLDGVPRYLALHWEGRTIAIQLESVPEMLRGLRALYYDAIRGRRGKVSTVGGGPSLHMSVHGDRGGMHALFEQETDERRQSLAFPLRDVPILLGAADSALERLRQPEKFKETT